MRRKSKVGKVLGGLSALLLLLAIAPMASAQQQLVVGTSTSTSTSSTPIYRSSSTSSFDFSVSKILYTATELAALPPGAVISGIEFYKTNNGGSNAPHAEMQVYLKNSTLTSMATGGLIEDDLASFTKVYDSTSYVMPTTVGWIDFGPFNQAPFVYTGNALEVIVDWDISAPSTPATNSFSWQYTSQTGRGAGYSSSSHHSASTNWGSSNGSTSRQPNIRFTYTTTFGMDPVTLSSPTAGFPWEGPASLSVVGGQMPYFFSLNRISNADWLNIHPQTGFLSGTPPKGLANTQAVFEVIVKDQNGFGNNTDTEQFNLFINGVPSLPYSNNFESDSNLDLFNFTSYPANGIEARASRSNLAGGGGIGSGLLFDTTNTNQGWVLNPETDAANIAVIDNPDLWFPGQAGALDASQHHGTAELFLDAEGIKALQIDFALRMVQESTLTGAHRRNNFIVEISDDLGQTWTRGAGATAQPSGIYQGKNTGTVNESILFTGLSGNQEYVIVRFRWLVRYASNASSGFKTYIGIDNLVVNAPLDILQETLPSAQETAPYNTLLQGTGGNPPYTNFAIVAGTLPQGMALIQDGSDWYLRATAFSIPTNAAATYPITIEVTDGSTATAQRAYNLVVAQEPPALGFANLPTLPSAGENIPYGFTLTATGGIPFPGGKYKWTILNSNAPWLTFTDEYSGRLEGTPPAASAGLQVNLTIRVEDLIGNSVDTSSPFTIDIVGEMTLITAPALRDAPESDSYREKLVVVGGQPPYQWSFVSGTLPAGLALRPLEGQIAGAPERGQAGSYSFRLLVIDSGTQMKEFDFTVDCTPASSSFFSIITANNFAPVTEGTDFVAELSASGGNPPYTWSVLPGTIPPGLSINQFGELTGVPSAGSAKTYTVDVRISDATAQTVTVPYTVTVLPEIAPVSILTGVDLPQRREGLFFVQTISATGGVPPFTWAHVGGALPNGVSFTQAGSSAVVSGLPQLNSIGNYSFTMRVTDSAAQIDERTFTMTVAPQATGTPLGIIWHSETGVLPKGREGDSYGLTLQGNGGVPPYSFSMTPGSTQLPAGLNLNTFGALSGTPVGATAGVYTFSIRISDSIGATSDRNFTVEILGADVDPNDPGDQTPVSGSLSANGGCVLDRNATTELALALMVLAMAFVGLRRRQRA
ncbi:MAG: putative Ig domain-containing protein [Planctomycetes bacterium]|nr:putative Ig domain-containing protein [Planctomycetota bacterium]